MRKILGLIPAKGGSTRLARKNIIKLGGKSLLAWAAEAAKSSGIMSRIIVSTEDQEIAAIARDCGVETPFMRPAQLAKDPAGVVDVALHALETLAEQGDHFDTLIILLPTCPFRTAHDIRSAYQLFTESNSCFLMSVSRYDHSPFSALRIDNDGLLKPYFPEHVRKRSQLMPEAFRANGAIHILNVKAFQKEKSYYAEPLKAYTMPWERSIDIDTDFDLLVAETVLRHQGCR